MIEEAWQEFKKVYFGPEIMKHKHTMVMLTKAFYAGALFVALFILKGANPKKLNDDLDAFVKARDTEYGLKQTSVGRIASRAMPPSESK